MVRRACRAAPSVMTQLPLTHAHPVHRGLRAELHEIAARLHREFDDRIGAEGVERVLEEVTARFEHARVRTFLPLLVHRYARSDLRAASGSGSVVDPGTRAEPMPAPPADAVTPG